MKTKEIGIVAAVCLMILSALASPAWADRSAVTIEAPATAQKGSETVIKLNVTHSGNSSFHHTQWVALKVNGKEVQRWEYSGSNLPSSNRFSVEYKIAVTEPLEVIAEASCNMHGSAGPAKATVRVK